MKQRISQLNELIMQKLGQIINREIEFPINCLVTITKVKISPDMKNAKIFISVIPDKFRGTCLKILKKKTKFSYNLLKKQITTKFTPNLHFLIDEQEIYASQIDKLLDELK